MGWFNEVGLCNFCLMEALIVWGILLFGSYGTLRIGTMTPRFGEIAVLGLLGDLFYVGTGGLGSNPEDLIDALFGEI